MEFTASAIGLEEYFDITDDGLDAGVYLDIQSQETGETVFRFKLIEPSKYDPNKYWQLKDCLETIQDICKADADVS